MDKNNFVRILKQQSSIFIYLSIRENGFTWLFLFLSLVISRYSFQEFWGKSADFSIFMSFCNLVRNIRIASNKTLKPNHQYPHSPYSSLYFS